MPERPVPMSPHVDSASLYTLRCRCESCGNMRPYSPYSEHWSLDGLFTASEALSQEPYLHR